MSHDMYVLDAETGKLAFVPQIPGENFKIDGRIVYNFENLLEDAKYGAKNCRVVEGLLKKLPYIFLYDGVDAYWPSPDNAKIRIGSDVVPLPVLMKIFGSHISEFYSQPFIEDFIGYEPQVVLPVNTKVYSNGSGVLSDIIRSMMISIQEEILLLCEKGEEIHPERELGHWQMQGTGHLTVTVRFSRDVGRSSNGGDYFYYDTYQVVEGGVLYNDSSSYSYRGNETPRFYQTENGFDFLKIVATAQEMAMMFAQGSNACSCPTCGHVYLRPELK